MAGFKKHIEVASVTSGLLATSALGSNITNTYESIILWIVGTLGGILPDIDSDNSTALTVIFGVLSLFISCLILGRFSSSLTVPELWFALLSANVILHYGIRPTFEALTIHRGIFHSIIAGLLFFAGTVASAHLLFGAEPIFSWLLGLFVLIGYLIHLTLDEIYSVDFMNVRIKRSFGTALKLYQYDNLVNSVIMISVTALLIYISPSSQQVYELVTSPDTHTQFKQAFTLSWIKQ